MRENSTYEHLSFSGGLPLEDKGLWRRAATVYIDILAQVKNSKDVLRIAEKRNRCVERSRGVN
ncbi:PerC family transcriptional regulator [Citrobacter freundii]|uniref:PerC family transcriptional regulator n=1 Tax=Citrobacter freundii TaxID=546 RepID=UPI004041C933